MIHQSNRKKAQYFYWVNQKKSTRDWIFLALCFLMIVLIGLFNYGIIPSKAGNRGPTSTVDTSEVKAAIYEPVAKVFIEKKRSKKRDKGVIGSAFYVGNNYLITARHVVGNLEEGEQVDIIFEKAPNGPINTVAQLKWKPTVSSDDQLRYLENDFALLELERPGDLPDDFPKAKLGSSNDVNLNTKVNAIGYPNNGFSITTGNIMNKEFHDSDLFKHSAGSWSGNSGGPLILERTGEVIGIVVAEQTGKFKGINMACKMNNALNAFKDAGISISN